MTVTWEELERECRECTKCKLGETRTNCVFGCGNKNADLMFHLTEKQLFFKHYNKTYSACQIKYL